MLPVGSRTLNSLPRRSVLRIGIISDTHGLLRSEAVEALGRSHIIIHAGDIGNPEVLDGLRSLAPVHAVRGNVDRGDWAVGLPHSRVVDASGKLLYVMHNLADLDVDPAAAGFSAVVTGHSHQPRIEEKNGVLFINPGSAGPRRFHLPVCIARVVLRNNTLRAEIVALDK